LTWSSYDGYPHLPSHDQYPHNPTPLLPSAAHNVHEIVIEEGEANEEDDRPPTAEPLLRGKDPIAVAIRISAIQRLAIRRFVITQPRLRIWVLVMLHKGVR
jgi:hypothetical protein